MSARTQGMRVIRSRGRSRSHIWALGATTGPWGAISETLSIGLGLSISLDPAVGDLLAEPKSRRRGLNSLKTSIISLIFSKAEFIRPALKDTVAGGFETG